MNKIYYGILGLLLLVLPGCHQEDTVAYLSGENSLVIVEDEQTQEKKQLVRGTEVRIDTFNEKEKNYRIYETSNDEKYYYLVPQENLTTDFQKVVTTKMVTSNMLVNLRKNRTSDISDEFLSKGEKVKVAFVDMEEDFNREDGTVEAYMIEKNGELYYFNALYTQEEFAQKENIFYSTYFDSWYYEGYSKETYIDELTYLDLGDTEFENKPLKKDARALHVGMSVAYEQQDYLIDLVHETGIDTLVLEIKADDGRLIFESETAKQFLKDPSMTQTTSLAKDEFEQLLATYHAEGIYLVGRVVTFKDPIFVSEYPQEAITYLDGTPFIHDGLAWPSPYSREAWRYVLSYAREAVSLGIDEIQFDYVRFPDGISFMEEQLDLKNIYGESKPQAILHFLYYAREQLHDVEAYLSADVFGWNMICGDDQEIGQFIPAMATVLDVISPMPYPDHFGPNSFGIEQPWQEPGVLLEAFTRESREILNTVPNPAVFRTWIQGYPCLEWVCEGTYDNPYRGYGQEEIIAQILGIRNANEAGYIIWAGDGGEQMFEWRKGGFIE